MEVVSIYLPTYLIPHMCVSCHSQSHEFADVSLSLPILFFLFSFPFLNASSSPNHDEHYEVSKTSIYSI